MLACLKNAFLLVKEHETILRAIERLDLENAGSNSVFVAFCMSCTTSKLFFSIFIPEMEKEALELSRENKFNEELNIQLEAKTTMFYEQMHATEMNTKRSALLRTNSTLMRTDFGLFRMQDTTAIIEQQIILMTKKVQAAESELEEEKWVVKSHRS